MSDASSRRVEAVTELRRGDAKLRDAVGAMTFSTGDRLAAAGAYYGRTQVLALLSIAEDVAAMRRLAEEQPS